MDTLNVPTHERILQAIMTPTCYIAVMEEQNLACGLGVYDRGYVGLFDIVTDRRTGSKAMARTWCVARSAWPGLLWRKLA